MFSGKKVAFGITGGIAAYKAAEVVSWLNQNHCRVQVLMTPGACEFITPLTMRTLSGHDVAVKEFAASDNIPIAHISTVSDADLLIILPATANIMAKAAHGIADDLLSSAILAAPCPILWAPAMNVHMYENSATQENVRKLAAWGHSFIEPGEGMLACGTIGRGRLADIAVIKEKITSALLPRQDFAGKKILVTAGPTVEPIDPVRYITNRSSGKMGYAIAVAARERGGEVTLVSGPVHLTVPAGVNLVRVETAEEMLQAVLNAYDTADIVIKAAAVADYRPVRAAEHKLKKDSADLTLVLEENADILKELGSKKSRQILVGFAAETEDLLTNAQKKLVEKNLDLIVANDVTKPGAGFDVDTNILTIISKTVCKNLPQMTKYQAAEAVLDAVLELKK